MPDRPGASSRDLPPFKRGQLRYFVTVADEGQVTRAAEKLHMAQPALSQVIASLEGQLGVRLLERHRRGVTLTPAGEVFLEKARRAVDAEADVLRTADSLARGLDGTSVLGDVGMPAWMVYPGLVEGFARPQAHAEIRTRQVPFPTLPAASWLADVDVAISSPVSPDPDVWVRPLLAEPRVVLTARGQPITGRRDRRGPLVRALSDVAESLAASAPEGASFLSRSS